MKLLSTLVVALSLLACGGSPTRPTPPGNPGPPPIGNRSAVLLGAGDIGECGVPGAAATGRLVAATPGEVFLAGDIGYFQGTRENFIQCFEPFWGHARQRWHPVPGNHEYESPNAGPYFDYFGDDAGPGRLGFYRFIAGEWLVLMLNSNTGVNVGSPQYEFVRAALQLQPGRCTAAIWHHPLFSSGPNGPNARMRDMFTLLYDHNVDVVINAHDHFYERFTRQDPSGRADSDRGIRQFTVGTGGAALSRFVMMSPNSAARVMNFGILKLELRPDSYEWQFLEVNGGIPDSGFSICH